MPRVAGGEGYRVGGQRGKAFEAWSSRVVLEWAPSFCSPVFDRFVGGGRRQPL